MVLNDMIEIVNKLVIGRAKVNHMSKEIIKLTLFTHAGAAS